MERYFLDSKDVEALLRDVDDNWNIDMDLAIEKASMDHNCTHRQVLQLLPLDRMTEYLIYKKFIPDIRDWKILESYFSSDWLDEGNSWNL